MAATPKPVRKAIKKRVASTQEYMQHSAAHKHTTPHEKRSIKKALPKMYKRQEKEGFHHTKKDKKK